MDPVADLGGGAFSSRTPAEPNGLLFGNNLGLLFFSSFYLKTLIFQKPHLAPNKKGLRSERAPENTYGFLVETI